MVKSYFFILLQIIFCISVFGQNQIDSINEVRTSKGICYEQSGKKLKLKDIKFIVYENKVALDYLKTARTYNTITNILSGCAGFMIGYPIGYLIPTGYFNAQMFAVGCGLGILAIPISLAYKNKLNLSINTYNRQLKHFSNNDNVDFQIGFVSNGLGVKISF